MHWGRTQETWVSYESGSRQLDLGLRVLYDSHLEVRGSPVKAMGEIVLQDPYFFFFFLALAIALLVSSLAAPHAVNLAGPGHTELGKLGSLEARLTSWGP